MFKTIINEKLAMMQIKKSMILAVMAVAGLGMTGCGGGGLNKTVRTMLLRGDTTEASFGQLCEIIRGDERAYAEYLTESGDVNVEAVNEMINTIGAGLRPACHWDVTAYGDKQLALSVYLERSGSMTPYDTQGGGGELKKAVNDLINFFPGSERKIYIVNDGVYDYSGSVDEFLKDKNIYATTANVGNAAYTDFGEIFASLLGSQKANEVSVLITDMIYSPREAKNVSVDKIFNEENSLATSVFRQYPGKSVIVSKLSGSYHGQYYTCHEGQYRYDGRRPFYVFVIADSRVMDRMMGAQEYARFVNIGAAEHSYRFNQPEREVEVAILPNWEGSKGRYRIARDEKLRLERCEGDRATGIMQFSIAANLDALGKSDALLCDAGSYEVQPGDGYRIAVERLDPSAVSGNNKSYLEGKSHIITVTGTPQVRRDELVIRLRNEFPAWIGESNAQIDTDASAADFGNTTFGIEPFLRGIYDAYAKQGDAYATIRVTIEQ